ncbi:MAG: hypothetical protein U1E27_03165, partial [Kiritimatiellia bacterium]|nr:hypothetical protein [Kiritimatiellia bacterium]
MNPDARRLWHSAAMVGAAVLCLWIAGSRQQVLLDWRREAQLTQADPLENLPPTAAFTTVALGAFRGLIVDLLWLRSASLQQEGRYFEMVQLAEWITTLQPRFASIWAYHAWNLSYNVSVMFDSPEDRWRWVQHGIRLLRDRGLRFNPGSATLYRELSWLFSHKIGENLDAAHETYKRAWAAEMEDALGSGTPDLEELAQAPTTREAWRQLPGAAELERELLRRGINPLDEPQLRLEARNPERTPLLDSPAGHALLAFLRAARLREQERLDPARMLELDNRYGPLDWRAPSTHALYWAVLGLPHARTEFERSSLNRQIFQSMTTAFLRGRIRFDPARNLLLQTPNPDLLPRVRATYEEALVRHRDESMRTSHANFLVDAAMICLSFHREATARELHQELRRRYPDRVDAAFDRFVATTYIEFAGKSAQDPLREAVIHALIQSRKSAAEQDAEQAAGYLRIARILW